jgi:hypothetical protein
MTERGCVMRDRLPLVISITALLVAVLGATPLGKAAYNAAIPRNSVGTLQLKRNAVTSSKLAPNTVRTGQVVDGSLLTTDFKPGQIPQGPKGDKGDKGDAGATKVVVRLSTLHTTAGSGAGGDTASCREGEKAVGGGVGPTGVTIGTFSVVNSRPNPPTAGATPTAWVGQVAWSNAGTTWAVYVICASP